MASSKMLAIALLAALAAYGVQCQDKPDAAPPGPPGPPPGPPTCMDLMTKADCKNGTDCAWCSSKFGPAMEKCYDEAQAKFLPPSVYECKTWGPETGADGEPQERVIPFAGAVAYAGGSGNVEDVRAVVATAFAGGDAIALPTASAVGNDASVALPTASAVGGAEDEQAAVATAFAGGDVEADPEPTPEPGPEPGPEPEPTCDDLMTADECIKGKPEKLALGKKGGKALDCSWCTNKYVPGAGGGKCYPEVVAKALPPMVFKCESGKDKPDADGALPTASAVGGAEDEQAVAATAFAGGDVEADPEPTPEPEPEPTCDGLKTADECIKGKSEEQQKLDLALGKKGKGEPALDCSWCTNKFAPGAGAGMCYPGVVAKALPPMVFKCESGKDEPDATEA